MPAPLPLVLDPLLSPEAADDVVRLWHDFGSYGQYSNEGFDTQFAPSLPQRYDARTNFVRTGGRFRRDEDPGLLGARTNYFRETYAYGDDVFAEGAKALMHHDVLVDAARRIHGRDVIVPAILYANILLPGQELAVHTDVPEYRGANRKIVPQWLLVVMHHSGLFDRWRMPIATAVTYFGEARGGAFAYYADGQYRTFEPTHNSGVVLDTDSVFHGVDRVDRVEGDESALARLRSGQRLHHVGGERWELRAGDEAIATFTTDQLRYSVSWKAYCFADEAERAAWETHADDLSLEQILDTLITDMDVARPDDDVELGKLLIDTYITFPS